MSCNARLRPALAIIIASFWLLGACGTAPKPSPPPPPPAPAPSAMNLPFGDPARRDREAQLILDAVTVTATGESLTPEALADRLAGVSLVFVGESHTSPGVHEAQRRLIEALSAAGRKVKVGLEMFPYTEQAALDHWTQSGGTEEELVRDAHWYKYWGFDFRYYRDIFALARARTLPLVGVNTPREVVTAVRKKGFEGLTPEEAAQIPKQIDLDNEEHRRLFSALMGGDAHGNMPISSMDGMFRAQCTWDATMAYHAVQGLADQSAPDPAGVVVVLLGSGHVAFGLGAPRQARQWFSGTMATVLPLPIIDEDGNRTKVRASVADYIWGLPPDPPSSPYPALGVTLTERQDIPHPVIATVSAGSPAAVAGLQAEDRLVSLDGVTVPDKETFLQVMGGKHWGDGAALVLERGGQTVTVTAPLRRKTR
jgi:uncharacterized iron-regulated protein